MENLNIYKKSSRKGAKTQRTQSYCLLFYRYTFKILTILKIIYLVKRESIE